jgi:DNA repair exonuclease SbcCD nuclease subunit
MCTQIIDLVKSRKPDLVVILGDVLDRHERIDMIPLTNAVAFMKSLQDLTPLYVLIGNHDRKNNQVFLTTEHPFTALKYWPNTVIVDVTKQFVINDWVLTMVPYVAPGRFKEALDTVPNWQTSKIIFCHQEFFNAQMGPIKSIHGDVWEKDLPLVISGHIHDYQQLQDNILYIGTPIQHKFGDTEDKIIALFTVYDDIVKHEKIQLNIPMKKIIHLTVDKINKYVLDPNIDAKIIITCQSTDIKVLNKHPKIEQWKQRNVKVIYKNITKLLKPDSLTNQPITLNTHDNFITLLHDNIKQNEQLLNIYNEVFNVT